MTRVFFAPTRQPTMQLPHSVHPARSGPTPPKYGSGTVSSGLPKKTPTGVRRKVSGTPRSAAAFSISRSTGPSQGFVTTPSMVEATA